MPTTTNAENQRQYKKDVLISCEKLKQLTFPYI